ncbi:Structural maintenance of chromosomes protein 5, partial [Coemansia spiralis]
MSPRVPRAAKRQKHAKAEEARGADESDDNWSVLDGVGAVRLDSSSDGGADEFQRGAIMHIRLTNFVTYDLMEVRPGPNMNMIIGPNGTGKSTIVCAIALGLGEKPALLGRAKGVAEFVKHGHERATIEITLAGTEGPVKIAREIIRDGGKSVWQINGRAATLAEVQRTTQSLSIQVGNLCQFLPQDRVVEFSKMSPQELLRETQRAVGRQDLLELQLELAKQRQEETRLVGDQQRLVQDIATLRKQNEVLERDVQRWQERQAAESQMRVLAALVPVARYTEAKNAHDQAKEDRRAAHARYLEIK